MTTRRRDWDCRATIKALELYYPDLPHSEFKRRIHALGFNPVSATLWGIRRETREAYRLLRSLGVEVTPPGPPPRWLNPPKPPAKKFTGWWNPDKG
jgi:hypothetical protein